MEFKEFTGKTVDDALTNATVSLGVTSSEIKYEVIEEGSNGFLGIGSKDAVIKVVISGNEDPKEVAKDFLNGVFEAMQLEVNISMDLEEADNTLSIDLAGPEMGVVRHLILYSILQILLLIVQLRIILELRLTLKIIDVVEKKL